MDIGLTKKLLGVWGGYALRVTADWPEWATARNIAIVRCDWPQTKALSCDLAISGQLICIFLSFCLSSKLDS